MSRAVLLNSCFVFGRRDFIQSIDPHIRTGVASVAAYAKHLGHKALVYDPELCFQNEEAFADAVLRFEPDTVGFPAYTEEVKQAARLAAVIKRYRPEVVTVIGGPHVTALPKETLDEFPSFDIGVVGEGEITFSEILSGKSFEQIGGIVWRRHGETVLAEPRNSIDCFDRLPFPDYSDYEIRRYDKGQYALSVEPVRGCPFPCTFCYRTFERTFRNKSPERIVREIEENVCGHGVRSFRFVTGTFPLSKDHAQEVLQLMIDKKFDLRWITSTRAHIVDREMARLMKRAGCDSVQLGIESGDRALLKRVAKPQDPARALEAFKICAEEGIPAGANFIIGLPGESDASIRKTRRLASSIRRYAMSANFAILVPYPGTEIYEHARRGEQGLRLKTTDWDDYGKQAGQALAHSRFSSRGLFLRQTWLYIAWLAHSPKELFSALGRNGGRTVAQVLLRLLT